MVLNEEPESEKYKAIFEGAIDGILVADIKTKKFILANPKICEITGYPLKELLKLDVNKIHPKKDLHYALDQFKKLAQRKIILAKNIPVMRKDKKVIYCNVASTIIKIGKKKFLVGFFEDITEQKKIEEELRDSEEKFRTIFENVSDEIIYIDNRGKIIDVNERSAELFGYKPREVIGKNFLRIGFLQAKDIPKIAKLFIGATKTGKNIGTMQLEIKHKNGNMVSAEVSTSLIKKNGKIEGILAIVRDITERKEIEEKLKESEEKFRNLFNDAVDPIIILDRSGKFIEINRKVEELLGYTKKDLIGKKFTETHILTPKSKLIVIKNFIKRMAGFKIGLYEVEFIKKNGEILTGEINAAPISENNKITGDMVIIRDVTFRKKAEEELKKAKDELSLKVKEMERFNKLAIGRELKMIELKKRIRELENKRINL